ncbi:HAD-IA family hydrolase [Saxibacter everestensis]|uniref:HAD-IA family hydrolase n=1 Tax=Saxibacter everestensis TaxID=2909229 RepID=A0ABY8QVQ9_9MICO|nr:HAD-IA family hydrolase [Brevibacteriaceae bacterium ZFBP1038]
MTNTPLGVLEGRTFDAVLFDLDGTLISSIPAVERSWRKWAELEGVDLADLETLHGVPSRQIVASLVPPERVEDSVRVIDDLELQDTDGVIVLPGAAEALKTLLVPVAGAERQWAAIATSCSRALAAVRIKSAGISRPDLVVTSTDVTKGKPDPEPYLLAAQRLGVKAANCLVVEDAPAGVSAGRLAGASTLAVRTSSSAQQLAEADAVVDDLGSVAFVLDDAGVRVRSAVR